MRCSKLWLKAQYKLRTGIHHGPYRPVIGTEVPTYILDILKKTLVRKQSKNIHPLPKPCEICGTLENIHRHHSDYSNAK